MTTLNVQGQKVTYSLDVDVPQVLRVYSGKPGCMCGCRGKYWSPAVNADAAGKDRGYALDADEVSDRQVTRVLKLVSAATLKQDDAKILHTTVGNRDYVVYLV